MKLAMGGEIADGPSLAALSFYLGPYRLSRVGDPRRARHP